METGICRFKVQYEVIIRTSGDETLGKPEIFGKFDSEAKARLAMVESDYKFTNYGQFRGWKSQSGYTTATINRVVEYFDHITATVS